MDIELAIRHFHKAFGVTEDSYITTRLVELRAKLLREEAHECEDAFYRLLSSHHMVTSASEEQKLKENLLKELVDVVYVTVGACASFGWDFTEAFRRVHASNMSKLGDDGMPIYREDGKVLKGPAYQAPDLRDLVE